MRIDDDKLGRLAMIWLVSENNLELRTQIEIQLIELSSENKNFSREFFYAYFTAQNKPVNIRFIPGTESFLHFGANLVVTPIFVEDIAEQIKLNIQENHSTYGLIVADDVNRVLDLRERNYLSATGFNTQHVMEISYL